MTKQPSHPSSKDQEQVSQFARGNQEDYAFTSPQNRDASAKVSPDSTIPVMTSPVSESSLRARKRQKLEAMQFQAQVETTKQEIATIKQKLGELTNRPNDAVSALGKQCVEIKQRAKALKHQLAEHSQWMQQVKTLMENAPLLDLSSGATQQQQQQQQQQPQPARNLYLVDGYCSSPKKKQSRQQDGKIDASSPLDTGETKQPKPPSLLQEQLRKEVEVSHRNVCDLLCAATTNAASFHLPLRFESRGWKIATGVLINKQVGFSCHRHLDSGPANQAKEVAAALWDFVQRDEVLRTFIPIVQDSMAVFQGDGYSLSRRVLQLAPEGLHQAAATVESIITGYDDTGQKMSWQISLEAVRDHYLCAFVADASGDISVSNATASAKRDLELQMSRLNMHNSFVMGARVTKTDKGPEIQIVGSARFELQNCNDPAFDLLQHLLWHMPVYEDLHLSAVAINFVWYHKDLTRLTTDALERYMNK